MSENISETIGVETLTRNTKITSRDELASNSQNLRWHEGNVECLGDSASLLKDVQQSRVTSLNRDDGRSSSEEERVGDKMCGSKVSRNTEILNDPRNLHHGANTRQRRVEVELAARDG